MKEWLGMLLMLALPVLLLALDWYHAALIGYGIYAVLGTLVIYPNMLLMHHDLARKFGVIADRMAPLHNVALAHLSVVVTYLAAGWHWVALFAAIFGLADLRRRDYLYSQLRMDEAIQRSYIRTRRG